MSSDESTTVAQLKELVTRFRDERDWAQFHNPKDLAVSISIEASELLELFQWRQTEELGEVVEERRAEIEAELADVFVYCLNLADTLGIDLASAVEAKLAENADKYPVEKARGSAKKYSELE